jgi:hypothetical protein
MSRLTAMLGGERCNMKGWKPPSITERTRNYARNLEGMSDAEKLEYFDNIVGAAFRKGYNMRKMDERKMRLSAAKVCELIETGAVKKMDSDTTQNREFWNGVAAGAGQCAASIKGAHEHDA